MIQEETKKIKDVTTDAQLAVCFMVASNFKDLLKKGIEDTNVECGMKPETFKRTVSRFSDVMNNSEEKPSGKFLKLFNRFSNMSPEELKELSSLAFTDENRNRGRIYQVESQARITKYSEHTKSNSHKENTNIMLYVNSVMQAYIKLGRNAVEARTMGIKKASIEFGKKASEIRKICK